MSVELKMDDKLDVQTYVIVSGIKLKLLPTKEMIMVQIICFKYLMKNNLNILFNWPNKILKCQFGNIMINVI